MSGTSGLSRALLLKPPATRPPVPIHQLAFPSPPLSLACPNGAHLIHSTLPSSALPDGFFVLPRFFDLGEQQTLLSSALDRLDRLGGVARRKVGGRRMASKADVQARRDALLGRGEGLEGWFREEDEYRFEQGHMDAVTHLYREAVLSSALPPPASHPAFAPTPSDLLKRLHFLFPRPPPPSDGASAAETSTGEPRIQTHVLHLAREGSIGPHVDSKTSMGGVLVGVCLGGSRVLRLARDRKGGEEGERGEGAEGRVDVLLESGTVYIQSGEVRNDYTHAVLPPIGAAGFPTADPPAWAVGPGQRLSVILRDLPPSTAVSNITSDPLSPAFYNPLGPSLPLAHDPLSSTDELHLSLSPHAASRAAANLELALDSRGDEWPGDREARERGARARRLRDGADVGAGERIRQGLKNRKWGGK